MGVTIKKWSGVAVLATLLSSTGSAVLAQEAELPSLHQSSFPEAVDRNTNLNSFWSEASIGGDAKFLFGLQYKDIQLDKDARRIQAMYQDMLKQQDDDHPTVRTRDMPSPYNTSLYELTDF
ncbi:MAG: hypothetical protein WA902_08385 [Thermosynechococcaceae cyanobacterium]